MERIEFRNPQRGITGIDLPFGGFWIEVDKETDWWIKYGGYTARDCFTKSKDEIVKLWAMERREHIRDFARRLIDGEEIIAELREEIKKLEERCKENEEKYDKMLESERKKYRELERENVRLRADVYRLQNEIAFINEHPVRYFIQRIIQRIFKRYRREEEEECEDGC